MVVRTFLAGLRCLWPIADYLPRTVKLLLVENLYDFIAHFVYCSQVFGNLQVSPRKILEKLFIACVRFVYGTSRYESVSNDVDVLLGCDFFYCFECLHIFEYFRQVAKGCIRQCCS